MIIITHKELALGFFNKLSILEGNMIILVQFLEKANIKYTVKKQIKLECDRVAKQIIKTRHQILDLID